MINFPYNIPSSINGYILKIKKGNYFLKNINLKIIDEKFVKGTQNKLLLKQHLAGRYAVEKLIKNIKRTSSLLIKKDALNAPLLYVDSEQWGLSISHTQDIAIAVINFQNKLIGIDVEENTPLNVKFGKILPNDALINRSLIERWVVFESIGKACKIGLRINKKQIKWEGENIVVNIGKENIKLKLYLLHQHNHIFSLVWEE
jgi:phosphopantetheinyl transferase (holo-ACP synthase)